MATINPRTKLSKAGIDKLMECLRDGMSLQGSANACRISYDRLLILMKEGKRGEALTMGIEIAQAEAEQRLCQRIMETGNARDALAMLTARFDSWDKKTGIKSNDNNIKAEALLKRMAAVPEQIKKRN